MKKTTRMSALSSIFIFIYFFSMILEKIKWDIGGWSFDLFTLLTPFYFVVSVKLIADGILRGAGKMNQFMIATFTDLVLRVVLAIVFSDFFGPVGIWCAWPVGWTIAMVMSVWFYKKGAWQRTE